jgi:hypothetical protein
VAAFGKGSNLWRVDVVLRRDGATDEEVDAILSLLAAALARLPTPDNEEALPDLATTGSFDMEPPGGSLGVTCWVRADSVGGAVQAGYDAVQSACTQVTTRPHALWDLRVLPRDAITPRADLGTPLVRVEAKSDRRRKRT